MGRGADTTQGDSPPLLPISSQHAPHQSARPAPSEPARCPHPPLQEQKLASSAAGRKQAGGAEPALTGRQLFERVGSSDLVLGDAGALGEGEEDAMAAPREAVDDDDDGSGEGGEGGEGGADADVLMDVGDAALFDEDDLPDDFPDDE